MKFEPEKVLEIFTEISKTPRGSGNEKQISDWLCNWAEINSFDYTQDKYLNVIIKIPGTGKYANTSFSESYVLQGHTDMVCQKLSTSTHDFNIDPIKPVIQDGWVMTDGQTTLGADNGIAIAIALYLSKLPDFEHKPIELLFTVDEERGLVGALNISSDEIKGKKLINLDSEDEGVITIGCAGSSDTTITKKYPIKNNVPQEMILIQAKITGGKGGHSGVMIHEKIANSHILMTRFLNKLCQVVELNLATWQGGSFRNAIPGETVCEFLIDKDELTKLENMAKDFNRIINIEYSNVEPNLQLIMEKKNKPDSLSYLIQQDTKQVIQTILAIPHGVLGMSNEVIGLVESSNNLAIISLKNGLFEIKTMHRSSVLSRMDEISNKINAIAKLINANIEYGNSSPPWQPNPDSNLLKEVVKKYEELYSKTPKVEAIHAGLECGVIGSKFEGMEMVSIGPTIIGAHTPKEKLEISTVKKIGDWLISILG